MWKVYPSIPKHEKVLRTNITEKYGLHTFVAATGLILLFALFHFSAPFFSRKINKRRGSLVRTTARNIYQLRQTYWLPFTLAIWSVGLSYLIFSECNQDLTYLVKRLGRVTVALLPPLYFLTLRPFPFPESFYLQLLPIHKWLGRVIVLLILGHGLLYTYIYTVTGKLYKLGQPKNLSGIFAILLFALIAVSSLHPIRRRFYKYFYGIHYLSAWLTIGMIWYHSTPPATGYMLLCLGILLSQLLYRFFQSAHTTLLVQYISPTLYLVTIPKMKLPPRLRNAKFIPGSHIRLSDSLYSPTTYLKSSHPYTVASLPDEPYLQLVVRKSKYPIKLRQTYSLFGIFRSVSTQFIDDAKTGNIRRALFVVGGSGIAFAAPVFRHLESLGVDVKLLWAIRDPQDAGVLKSIGLHDAVVEGKVEIYFTRESRLKRRLSTASLLEAQLYKELNDDEYLDIAVDDLCCMDTPQIYQDEERGYDEHGIDEYYDYDDNEDDDDNDSESESTLSGGEPTVTTRNGEASLHTSNETEPLLSRPAVKYTVIDPIHHHHRKLSSSRSKPRYIDIRDEYAHAMFNSRPVLNIRLQAWLCGISINADDCCCVDQLLQINQNSRRGGWVISAGSHKLVHDTQKWADSKGFKFYQEEFNL